MDLFLFIPIGEWETRVLGVYAASFSAHLYLFATTLRLIMAKTTTAWKDKEDKWIVCGSEEAAVFLYPEPRGQ